MYCKLTGKWKKTISINFKEMIFAYCVPSHMSTHFMLTIE